MGNKFKKFTYRGIIHSYRPGKRGGRKTDDAENCSILEAKVIHRVLSIRNKDNHLHVEYIKGFGTVEL